jgi:hypothetical protein
MHILTQPSNSPDLNLCDLTFFRSLDCCVSRMKHNAHSMVELMHLVVDDNFMMAYEDGKFERGFGHLYAVLRSILATRGSNDFRNPHDNVRMRHAAGECLNYVGMNNEQINVLINVVNNYFPQLEPLEDF